MNGLTREELMEIFDCISDGIFVTDGEGKVLFLTKSPSLCVITAGMKL